MMQGAIYDNPLTKRREYWRNGKVEFFITAVAIAHGKGDGPGTPLALQARGPFQPGRLIGDEKAVKADRRAGRGD